VQDDTATPLQQLQQIETFIRGILTAFVDEDLPTAGRRAVQDIRQTMAQARKALRDYEREEDARQQASLLPESIAGLEQARRNILEASQYDVFSAVDVAHVTAKIDQLTDRLR
jgi:hypothetical protein